MNHMRTFKCLIYENKRFVVNMGSPQADSEEKQEMDDSGCIQDESPPTKRCENGTVGVQLLDLSDDVLLLILRFLTPRDLKALGYTCPRLGALILDRSLWQAVDARGQPWGRARLRWYLSHALHAGTRELLMTGYAREARECLGLVNQTREEMEAAKQLANNNGNENGNNKEDNNNIDQDDMEVEQDSQAEQNRVQSPRVIDVATMSPSGRLYIENGREEAPEAWAWPRPSDSLISDASCPGPQFTLTHCVLRQLADTCPALVSLGLEYCNINCNTTNISQFPPTLKKLSMRGSKCYNLPLDRSFLFKIQDTLPGLEILDVSECEWMEPASLLPLSKLPVLKHLFARDCLRLTEFVAYASLATRYGFTKLEWLDLRGSPVGDSEVSALGWLPRLSRLWLAPARAQPPPPAPPAPRPPADLWEAQVPYYYKIKEPQEWKEDHSNADKCYAEEGNHTWRAENGTSRDTNAKSPKSTVSPQRALSPKKAPSPPKPPTTKTSPNAPSTSNTPTKSPCSNGSISRSSNGSGDGPSTSKSPDSKPPKRKTSSSPTPGPSKRRRGDGDSDESDSSDDDDVPLKTLLKMPAVNEGASTSKDASTSPTAPAQIQQDIEAEPRHHVLYVNVGQQLHAVYRLSLDNEHIVSFNRNSIRRLNTRILLSPPGAHLDASSLITDSAIRRFGRADGEDINYVHIGPNGPYAAPSAPGARPDRSSLTHLTVTGFRHITDRSLEHLATSAPHLQFLDFSETRVTDAGVTNFRSLRPECEVRYSKYIEKKED